MWFEERRPNLPFAVLMTWAVPGLGLAYTGSFQAGVVVAVLTPLLTFMLMWGFEVTGAPISELYGSAWIVILGYFLVGVVLTVLAARRSTRVLSMRGIAAFGAASLTVSIVGMTVPGPLQRFSSLEHVSLPGQTMMPSIFPGDGLAIDTTVPVSDLRRGDIIMFEMMGDRQVARVIGLPGDSLGSGMKTDILNDESVLHERCRPVVDELLKEAGVNIGPINCFLEKLPGGRTHRILRNWSMPTIGTRGAADVRAGQLYVMGDNRGFSTDSRRFGPIPRHAYLGVFRGVYREGDERFARISREEDRGRDSGL